MTNDEQSTFVIETRHARADGAEDFIRNRAGPLGDIVGGDLLVTLTSDDDGFSRFCFTSHPARSAGPAFLSAESLRAAMCHLARARRSKFRATQLASLRCL